MPCTVRGVGEVKPPKTALAVEMVVERALKKDPTGVSLKEYFATCCPPKVFRKVMREHVNEAILVGMIRVADALKRDSDHGPLAEHLAGMGRIKRMDTTIMMLDEKDAAMLRGAVEDCVGEVDVVDKIQAKFRASLRLEN